MADIWNQAPPAFDPVKFIPANCKEVILAYPVHNIIAAAHEETKWKDQFTNHWCFYLQTSPESSVRVDCQPSHAVPGTVINGSKAYLIVSHLDYIVSSGAIKQVVLSAAGGLTVGNVVDKL